MRVAIALVLLCTSTSFAEAQVRLIPPSGSTMAPGQRFDLRLEAFDVTAVPRSFSLTINGQDRTRDVFRDSTLEMFAVMDAEGKPNGTQGAGVTRRDWSIRQPGRYELKSVIVDAAGQRHEASTTLEVIAIRPGTQTAKNIIFFIGDGLGPAQRTAARIASKGITAGRVNGRLEMDQMEAAGFVMTSSLDALVTDSSPGAAGYATGNKSINNTHGVFPDYTGPNGGRGTTVGRIVDGLEEYAPAVNQALVDNPRVENIAELLRRTRNAAVGVVSTVAVTDSTPGSFASHTFSRYIHGVIAEQMFNGGKGPEVIMGAGMRAFLPTGHPLLKGFKARSDQRNLIDEFRNSGYSFAGTAAEMSAVEKSRKLLGLFHPIDMASRLDRMDARKGGAAGLEAVGAFPDQPDLEGMTLKAIEVLAQNPSGFFLMVEGGSVDREYHRMDPYRGIVDTIELDKAVGAAKKWARENGNNTLIIVTADHETAGLTLPGVQISGTYQGRAFPNYVDQDKDGFPDGIPTQPMAFDFGSRFRPLPADTNHTHSRPRNLRELNPSAPDPPNSQNPPSASHTAVDVPLTASGPGAQYFNGLMDNTEVFFRMLRAVGYVGR